MKKTLIFVVFIQVTLAGCSLIAASGAELTGLALLHDRRSTLAIIKDERIEVNAAIELNSDDDIRKNCHFNITAYNGTTLITGEAATEQLRDKIISIVRIISGVKIVHNELQISAPSSLATRSHDTLITTKIKSSLSKVKDIPGFDTTRVKVITENGIVYLLGLVHKKEANVTTEIARRESGVKQVVKIFEYIAD
ncbi:MAG: BON domain-containing protein [Methylococcales bacterium]|nr:BON domain-containing protein [Methylococcales bacterium]